MSDNILANFTPGSEEKTTSSARRLKIGIIGTGWVASAHIQAMKKCEDVDVVALADLIPGKAAKFAEKYGIPNARIYGSHTELLAAERDLDGVSICTYNRTHAVCAIDSFNAGLNVLLEKPMCVTAEEAYDIIRAERRSGKLLIIGFQPRFDANMKQIKKIVQSGELGRIYYIQTGGGRRWGVPNSTFIEDKTAGIGALGDIGCYSLDMVLNAIGYPKPLTVSGYISGVLGSDPLYNNPTDAARFNVDDFGAGFIRLEGDIILDFRIAWAMHMDSPGDTIIMGTRGGLRIPATRDWNGTVGGPMTVYRTVGGLETEYKLPIIKDETSLFYYKVRAFFDAILNGTPSPIPSSQIIYNQAIIDGIVRSSKLGREVTIDIPADVQ